MQNISLKNIAPFTSYLTLSKLVLCWFYPSIFVSWPYRKIVRVQVVPLESLSLVFFSPPPFFVFIKL